MEARQLFSNLHHYIKDYQGNVRCEVRHDGTLVESNEYYPYGGLFSATASVQPYKYGAKELDRTNGLDLYDSEARWYDSLLGRTTTMDPLAEKYYSLSPYTWCAGNPVKFVDQDGRIIIFINGMHVDSGGKSQYWNGLDKKIQVSLNDMNSMYLDGSSGGVLHIAIPSIYEGNLNPQSRISYGLRKGLFIAQSIYNNLGDDESITIVTHSLGAAYAKGFITALQLYAIVNGIDHRIKMEIDLAPYQPLLQMKCPGITTIVVSHLFDHVAGFLPIIGANNNITRTDESFFNILKEHSIDSFTIEEIESIINSILKSESKKY